MYGYITNSQRDQLSAGLTALLAEHCTGVVEVMVRISFRPEFFQGLILQLLKVTPNLRGCPPGKKIRTRAVLNETPTFYI